MMRGGYRLNTAVLAVAIAAVAAACQRKAPEARAVARVAEARLTEADIEARIPTHLIGRVTVQDKRRIAEGWVEEELLYQEALRRKLDEDPAVEERVSRAVRDMLVAELLEREFQKDAAVTDEEIRAYYESHQEDFVRDRPEIRARHILVEDKSEQDQVWRQLRGGELFDQMAREESIDASAEAGGDLGYFTEDMVDPAFWEACEKAKVGRRVQVVTRLGRHIVEVLDRREAGTVKDLTEVWGEIRQRILVERRQAKRMELLAGLRNRVAWSVEIGEE